MTDAKSINHFDKMHQAVQSCHSILTENTHINAEQRNRLLTMRLLRRLAWRIDKRVPFAGVHLDRKKARYTLLLNPDWLHETGWVEFYATMMHESLHVFFRDIPNFLRLLSGNGGEAARGKLAKLHNIAADMANNQHIERMYPLTGDQHDDLGYWVLPEEYNYARGESTQYYFAKLLAEWDGDCQRTQKTLEDLISNLTSPQEDSPGASGGEDDSTSDESSSNAGDEDANAKGASGSSSQGDPFGEPGSASAVDALLDQAMDEAGTQHLTDNQKKLCKQLTQPDPQHSWGNGGVLDDIDDMSDDEMRELADLLEAQSAKIVKEVAQESRKEVGKAPSHLKQILEDALDELDYEEVVPWEAQLRGLVESQVSPKKRLEPRTMHRRKYLTHTYNDDDELVELPQILPRYPGKHRVKDFVILYAIDTSGSMSNQEILSGLLELQSLKKARPHTYVLVAQCDSNISDFTDLGDMNVKEYVDSIGRTSQGGTRFDQPFWAANAISNQEEYLGKIVRPSIREKIQQAASKYKQVDVVVYVTDTYGTAPSRQKTRGYRTIWICTTPNRTPKFVDHAFGTFLYTE